MLLSEAGGAYWPLATYPCLFLEPSPNAHRPLSPPVPSLPLPGPSSPPHTPFLPLGRLCQRSPRTVPFHCSVSGHTKEGDCPRHWPGASKGIHQYRRSLPPPTPIPPSVLLFECVIQPRDFQFSFFSSGFETARDHRRRGWDPPPAVVRHSNTSLHLGARIYHFWPFGPFLDSRTRRGGGGQNGGCRSALHSTYSRLATRTELGPYGSLYLVEPARFHLKMDHTAGCHGVRDASLTTHLQSFDGPIIVKEERSSLERPAWHTELLQS